MDSCGASDPFSRGHGARVGERLRWHAPPRVCGGTSRAAQASSCTLTMALSTAFVDQARWAARKQQKCRAQK